MASKVLLGPQKLRRSLTRERVLRASVELLLESGVGAFSAKAVAERAGISRGALLKQYGTSAQLIAALAEHVIRESAELTAIDAGAMADDAAGMRHLFACAWEDFKTPPFLVLLEIVLASRCDPDLAEHLARVGAVIYREQIARTLPFFARLGVSDARGAEILFIEFVATLRGLAIERLLTGDHAKVERVFQSALDGFMERLTGRPLRA